MTHLTDAYAPSNSGPYCTRQARHYYRNPQHYVGPRGRHAWDPKLGSGLIFLKLTILILGLAGETKSAVQALWPENNVRGPKILSIRVNLGARRAYV